SPDISHRELEHGRFSVDRAEPLLSVQPRGWSDKGRGLPGTSHANMGTLIYGDWPSITQSPPNSDRTRSQVPGTGMQRSAGNPT
ncbi:MAG: hypothetical protein KDI37_18620, partial [Xanthomonadales bacterium]|nr:hypothetical protein [Xanthomonadales bacterium]